MQLFGSSDSGHSYKVRNYLLMAGLRHDYRWVDLSLPRHDRPADFRAISKFGEVPVWVDDAGAAMSQSNAILIRLAQVTGHFAGAPSDWTAVLEWLSWEANRVGFSVPNLRYAVRWAPQPPDVMRWLRARADLDLQTLDAVLAHADFLVGSGPTVADVSCSAYLWWMDEAGLHSSDYPHMLRWRDRLSSLPGWRHPDEALQAAPLS